MPVFDTVFFDSGGTLYGPGDGSGPSASEVSAGRVGRVARALEGLESPVEDEALRQHLQECESRVHKEFGDGYNFFRLTDALVDSMGLGIGSEGAALLADAYAGPRYRPWLFPGTHEVLETLYDRGVYLGIIANTAWPGFCMDRAFTGVGLLQWFSTRIYSGDLGISKPDPRIFEHATAVSGRKDTRLLYVGNDLTADVKGASGVDWATAFRGDSGGLADFDFRETVELLEFIEP